MDLISLAALVAFAGVIVAGWLYLRTRFKAGPSPNRSSGPEQVEVARFDAIAPFDIDQFSKTEKENAGASVIGWRPDAIMVLDEELRLDWANRTAELWFGISLAEDFQEKLDLILPQEELIKYLKSPHRTSFFDCPVSADSEIIIRARVFPYNRNQLLVQARDISQIKALELMRRDFVSSASHELRTPVSVIYGYLEMMMQEDSKGVGAEWRPAIRQMHEQTERIKNIIEDMLLLSRLEATDSTEEHDYASVTPMLDSAFNNAKVLSGDKNHRIKVNADPDYFLLCNKESIISLLNNLVSNAIRYTPAGGDITIKWKVSAEGGSLSVTDTGMGIAEQDIPRVTERFYRSDPARSRETGGTGLGLTIVNHIVNRHQAVLHIESVLGRGSQFRVKFPAERIRKSRTQAELLLN